MSQVKNKPTKKSVQPAGGKKAPASPAERTPFISTSAKACFEHFQSLAREVPKDGLEVFKTDAELARANAHRGVDAILPHLDTVRKKLPMCSIPDILEVRELSLALLFAAGKVVRAVSTREIEERLAAVRPMREAALKQLEVFASLGIVPAHVPAGIRRGTGSLDTARDAQAIAGVFHDHRAAIAGKHPFSQEQLDKLAADGDWLVAQLKPASAKAAPAERDPASVLRDQLGALLVERHERLREAGVVVFGLKNLDEHVPPLGARVGTARGSSTGAGAVPAPSGPSGGDA